MHHEYLFFIFSIALLLSSTAGGSGSTETPPPPPAQQPKTQVGYYKKSCPTAEAVVRKVMSEAFKIEKRSAASLLRLTFHDCFVDGCGGSVLLDDTNTTLGEKTGLSNVDSLRKFELIDQIKEALENVCPRIVSCADIIQLAARDAVVLTGGPSWAVPTGRLDTRNVSVDTANDILPSPNGSNATSLINLFAKFGLTAREMVALSGSHTIGDARCFSLFPRLYDFRGTGRVDPSIEYSFKKKLMCLCPKNGNESVIVGFDSTPTVFDNLYFIELRQRKGLMNSDAVLFNDYHTSGIVRDFATSKRIFYNVFVGAMLKMGELKPKFPGGEIRKNCRKVNG